MAFLSRQRGIDCSLKKKGTIVEIEKAKARVGECQWLSTICVCTRRGWIRRCICVPVCRCVFAYWGCKYTFHPETLILIQLAVSPYKTAPGKYLHSSMLIASLMAGAECSIVPRWRGRWGEIRGSSIATKGGSSEEGWGVVLGNKLLMRLADGEKKNTQKNREKWEYMKPHIPLPIVIFSHTNALHTGPPWLTVLLIPASCVCM